VLGAAETEGARACAAHSWLSANSCTHDKTEDALRNTIIALLERAPLFFGAQILTESTSPHAATCALSVASSRLAALGTALRHESVTARYTRLCSTS
jgi:hypothetical protein